LEEKREEFTPVGHQNNVCSVEFSKDGKFLASGSFDFAIKVWNLEEKRKDITLADHWGSVKSVAFSKMRNSSQADLKTRLSKFGLLDKSLFLSLNA